MLWEPSGVASYAGGWGLGPPCARAGWVSLSAVARGPARAESHSGHDNLRSVGDGEFFTGGNDFYQWENSCHAGKVIFTAGENPLCEHPSR